MTKANEPAFPYIHKWTHKTTDGDVELASRSNGLTKREYFAAMAMNGFLANSFNDGMNQPLSTASNLQIAKMSAEQADALILELEKTKND